MIPDELGALSAVERQVWEAFPYGREVVLTGDEPAAIRATVIRSLLLGAVAAEPGRQAALRLRGGVVAGRLDLTQTEVEAPMEFAGCTFDTAPVLSSARLRGVSFEGSTLPGLDAFAATVQGTLSLVKCTLTDAVVVHGSHIGGDLDLDWARLTAGRRPEDQFGDRVAALFADAVHVERNVYLQGMTATGDVDLAGIRVGGVIRAQRGMRVEGRLRLRGADITGGVDLTDVVLGDLDGWGMRAGELSLRPERIAGVVDLGQAQIQVIRDDPDRPVGRLRLDGLRYTALEPAGTVRSRLRWVDRDPDGYRPQPYEQLAAFYRQIGREADARTVLLSRQRRRRRELTPPGALWSGLQDLLVGYGYRPGRAALWLLALTAAGATVFSRNPPGGGRGGPAFNSFTYTLDLLIPIANLGQESVFGIGGNARWLAYVLIVLGWLLFTAVAAALTRTFSRS